MVKLDTALIRLAMAQLGVFSSQQAHRYGHTDQDLARAVVSGQLVRLKYGAYAVASVHEAADDVGRFALMTRGIVTARQSQSWASHQAALALMGLPVHAVPLDTVDVCGLVRRPFRSAGLVVHPMPTDERCLLIGGTPSVSVATALVQVAARSFEAGLVAVDAALHSGQAGPPDLHDATGRILLGPRLRARVSRVIELADRRCESPGESLTRLLLVGLGLPFRSQVSVSDGFGMIGRVDFLVGERVVVEFDGMVKYGGADGREALAAREAAGGSTSRCWVRGRAADLGRPAAPGAGRAADPPSHRPGCRVAPLKAPRLIWAEGWADPSVAAEGSGPGCRCTQSSSGQGRPGAQPTGPRLAEAQRGCSRECRRE